MTKRQCLWIILWGVLLAGGLRADTVTYDSNTLVPFGGSAVLNISGDQAEGVVNNAAFDQSLGTLNSVTFSWTANFSGLVEYGTPLGSPDYPYGSSLLLDEDETATGSVDGFQGSETVNVNIPNLFFYTGCHCIMGFNFSMTGTELITDNLSQFENPDGHASFFGTIDGVDLEPLPDSVLYLENFVESQSASWETVITYDYTPAVPEPHYGPVVLLGFGIIAVFVRRHHPSAH